MLINYENSKKHTGNTLPQNLILISKNKTKGKAKCAICLSERTFIDKREDEYHLESKLKVCFDFFKGWCYKRTCGYIV